MRYIFVSYFYLVGWAVKKKAESEGSSRSVHYGYILSKWNRVRGGTADKHNNSNLMNKLLIILGGNKC
jgi:hypothetical protein